MNFRDLLNKPLPSANLGGSDYVKESIDEDDVCTDTNCNDDDCPVHGDLDKPRIPANDDADKSINDKIASQVDPEDPTDAFISDDLDISDDSEEQRIDDRIQRVATPILIKDTLSDDEIDTFAESCDSDVAMCEDFVTERTIVKFDKKSRYAQLRKVAILAIAKEKKHPLYKKLTVCWKMEKAIERKFEELYGSQANARVQVYLKRARQSKSQAVKKAAEKVSK